MKSPISLTRNTPLYCTLAAAILLLPAPASAANNMAAIRGGSFRPLYLAADAPLSKVDNFLLDKKPVTNAQLAAFVRQQPQWQRGRVPAVFAEKQYLHHWVKQGKGYAPRREDANKPVTYISWFAAHAYCQAQGKKLPDTLQWEDAARASSTRADGSQEAGYRQKILNWYGKASHSPMQNVGQDRANYWGVHNLHGLIWEWTEDFNNASMLGGDSRNAKAAEGMFCGAGGGTADPGDYAAFMRYGFRSSLQAKFTLNSLGFRCAK